MYNIINIYQCKMKLVFKISFLNCYRKLLFLNCYKKM